MGGMKEILEQMKGLEVEATTVVDLPNLLPLDDRVARLEKLVKKLLESSARLAKEVAAVDAAADASTADIHQIWIRIDRLERHVLDFMKAKGGPGYWYLDPQ